jgi:carnitine 3-dehydrogenase / betainyl-CoA thioesterase
MRDLGPATEDEMILGFLRAEIDSPRFGAHVRHLLGDVNLVLNADLDDAAQNDARRSALRAFRGFGKNRYLFQGFPSESLWREALWLVSDGTATVEEIDDAIRYGPGLRWSVMGTFLTYRIAGGEAGIRDFMDQFGPALQWPWSRLTEVPELTDALLETIQRQSDAQAAERSVSELERLRDDCLVDILQALRTNDVGAGATLRAYEDRLLDHAAPVRPGEHDVAVPLRLHETRVPPTWVDYNGHAHESAYLRLTGDATDALLNLVGVDAAYRREGGSYFTVETHVCHLHEMKAGELVHITTQVLGADEKRIHVFHRVLRSADDQELATVEQVLLHVGTAEGRASSAGSDVLAHVRALTEAHSALEQPHRVGRSIELPAKPRPSLP